MPIGPSRESRKPAWKLAEEEIRNVISRYATGPVEVEVTSDDSAIVKVLDEDMRKVIGKGGNVIDRIENILGLHIDVREIEAEVPKSTKGLKRGERKSFPGKAREPTPEKIAPASPVHPVIERTKKHLILGAPELSGRDVEIFIEDEYLFSATVSRHGDVKLRINSDLAIEIMEAQDSGDFIEVRPL
jgi:ATPase